MTDKRILLAEKLKTKHPENLKMVVGFDGFIDEIIHAVDKRMDSNNFKRIDTISDLAKRIERASGLSTNIELVPTVKKLGGNGPIMCNALAQHKGSLTYIGSLGKPNIDEVFLAMPKNIKLHSFAEAGHTDALEFDDGKLMFGKMVSLGDVNYKNFIDSFGEDEFVKLLDETNLFASVNWSMLPNMTSFWGEIIKNILPKLNKNSEKRIFFVDLADPEKKEAQEIKDALNLLKSFNQYFHVVLGLNKKEAYDVANVLELFDSESLEHMQVSLEDLNLGLYEYLQIYSVVIHPVDRSTTVIKNKFYEELGPYVKKPKLSTGAGDNFNAGFVLGLLLELNPDEALLLGMSTSGFYVRNARSPKFNELIEFLGDWTNDLI